MGHIARECPQGQASSGQRGAISELTVGDMGRSHRVFAAVDNHQVEHQAIVIEATSSIQGNMVTILFDSGATDSFISPFVVEHCGLVVVSQDVSWEVELASGTRVLVSSLVHDCPIQIGDMSSMTSLRITPLSSYDVILGMDWLYAHNTKMDCQQKMLECVDDDGISRVILGVKRPISLRMISAMQLK